MAGVSVMGYGKLRFRINEILQEQGISKNRICRDLDIPRTNFNRYCRNEFERIDSNLVCKLLSYLHVSIGELIQYIPESDSPLQNH